MKTFSILFVAASCGAGLIAQNPTTTPLLVGSSFQENVGRSIANAGDVNGDGIDDIILGADHDSSASGKRQAGRVDVLDGANPSNVLYSWVGGFTGDFFGCAVDGAGDVDGDGVADLVVGAYGRDQLVAPGPYFNEAGSVYVYSGATGQLLFQSDAWDYPAWIRDGARFGYAVAGAGDVNGDGYDDVIAGAYVAGSAANPAEGVAVVLSGASALNPGSPPTVLHTFSGGAVNQFLGFAVDGAGDVDFDGFDDLIVGIVGANGFDGEARVYSGRDGSLLHTFTAPTQNGGSSSLNAFLGGSVAGAGDVDKDGHADLIVGVVFDDTAGVDHGGALVFSGRTGNLLHQFTGLSASSLYGFAVAGDGDVDGDGHADLAVGAVLDNSSGNINGAVRAYSGLDGSQLAVFQGQQVGGGYGFSVDLGGDHDGDGFAEIVTGTPFHDLNLGVLNEEGRADLLDVGFTGTPARVREIGPGCPSGSGTMPKITVYGVPRLGDVFQLRLRGAQPGKYWVLNMGAQLNAPLDGVGMPGCVAYSTANGFILSASSNMTDPVTGHQLYSLPAPIPNVSGLIGLSIYAQFIVVDDAPAANSAALVTSNGMELTFGR